MATSAKDLGILLNQLLSGTIDDGQFSRHLAKHYDAALLRGLFAQVKCVADESFRSGDFERAKDSYTGCIVLVKNDFERAKLYSNRSLCFYKNQQYLHSYSDAVKCIALAPKWPKGWFRVAKALVQLEKYDHALAAMRRTRLLMLQQSKGHARQPDGDVREIDKEIETISSVMHGKRRVQRYQTDYTRFEGLVQELERQDAATRPQIADPEIEFSAELSEQQKMFLKAQICGEPMSELDATTTYSSTVSAIDFSSWTLEPECFGKAETALSDFLKLCSLTAFPTTSLTYFDSGISHVMAEAVLKHVTSDANVVLLGGGLIIPAVVAASKCTNVTVVTDNSMEVDAITGALPATCACNLNFVSPQAILEADASVYGIEPPVELPQFVNGEESHLAKTGQTLLTQETCAKVYSLLQPDLLILDPSFMPPYLLGPGMPLDLLKRFQLTSCMVVPFKITLNVALAQFAPPLDENDLTAEGYRYSLLPMPLPTAIAPHVTLVSELTAAWTFSEFSETLADPNLDVNVGLLRTSRPCEYNMVILSLTLHLSEDHLIDGWSVYMQNADKGLENHTSLAPHFLWLHEVAVTESSLSGSQASSVTSSTSSDAVPGTTEHKWLMDLKQQLAPSSIFSSPQSSTRLFDDVIVPGIQTIRLHLNSGRLETVSVLCGDRLTHTSHDGVRARYNLAAADWWRHVALGPCIGMQKPLNPVENLQPLTINEKLPTDCQVVRISTKGHEQLSLNQAWLEAIRLLRLRKFDDVAAYKKKMRANLLVQANGLARMRVGVFNVMHPRVGFELLLDTMVVQAHKSGLPPGSIVLESAVDVFCVSNACRRILQEMVGSNAEIKRLRDAVQTKKAKQSLHWEKGRSLVAPALPADGRSDTVPVTPSSPVEATDELNAFRRSLFADDLLTIDQSTPALIRPKTVPKNELLQSLASLHGCPPATPGLDNSTNCRIVSSRYELIVLETPESLSQLVVWCRDSYLRELFYAKCILAAPSQPLFSPQRFVVKGFLAWLPERIGCAVNGVSVRLDVINSSLRTHYNMICWDTIAGARRVSEPNEIVSLNVDSSLDLRAISHLGKPRTVQFKLKRMPTMSRDDSAAGYQTEPLDECNSGLGSVSSDATLPDECAEMAGSKVVQSIASDDTFGRGSAVCYNALITYAEYTICDRLVLTHQPLSLSVAGSAHNLPGASQQFHKMKKAHSYADSVNVVLNMDLQTGSLAVRSAESSDAGDKRLERLEGTMQYLAKQQAAVAKQISVAMSSSAKLCRDVQRACLRLARSDQLTHAQSAALNNILFSTLN